MSHDVMIAEQNYADAFSRLGRKVRQHHWRLLHALRDAPQRTMSASELANGEYPSDGGHWRWTLRPEVVEAIRKF